MHSKEEKNKEITQKLTTVSHTGSFSVSKSVSRLGILLAFVPAISPLKSGY